MVEKENGEVSELGEKNWKPLNKNPVTDIYYNLEGKKDLAEYLIIGKEEVTYQKGGEIIKENVAELKKLKSFKNLLK